MRGPLRSGLCWGDGWVVRFCRVNWRSQVSRTRTVGVTIPLTVKTLIEFL